MDVQFHSKGNNEMKQDKSLRERGGAREGERGRGRKREIKIWIWKKTTKN